MKRKLIVLLFLLFFSFTSEALAENKLYFTDNNERIYYDTKQLNKNEFMNHLYMLPGGTYTDELLIENGSTTDYTLYLKVKEKEQSEEAKAFLDEIKMKIYLDDTLIYDGFAKGLDYNHNGVNLQDVIEIGDCQTNEVHKLLVETTLSKDFSDPTGNDASYIDWEFYAQYAEKIIPIEPNPNTGDKIKIMFIIFGGSLILTILLIILTRKFNNDAIT